MKIYPSDSSAFDTSNCGWLGIDGDVCRFLSRLPMKVHWMKYGLPSNDIINCVMRMILLEDLKKLYGKW